jgi:hypothetical protein
VCVCVCVCVRVCVHFSIYTADMLLQTVTGGWEDAMIGFMNRFFFYLVCVRVHLPKP